MSIGKEETGIVEWFSESGQSFGFIDRPDGGQIYIHYKNLSFDNMRNGKRRDLEKGDTVSYTIGTGYFNSGTQAIEAKLDKWADVS